MTQKQSKMIDLDLILLNACKESGKNVREWYAAKQAMREAIRQALELAAENARVLHHDGFNKIDTSISYFQNGADNLQIDKQSIISVNELVK